MSRSDALRSSPITMYEERAVRKNLRRGRREGENISLCHPPLIQNIHISLCHPSLGRNLHTSRPYLPWTGRKGTRRTQSKRDAGKPRAKARLRTSEEGARERGEKEQKSDILSNQTIGNCRKRRALEPQSVDLCLAAKHRTNRDSDHASAAEKRAHILITIWSLNRLDRDEQNQGEEERGESYAVLNGAAMGGREQPGRGYLDRNNTKKLSTFARHYRKLSVKLAPVISIMNVQGGKSCRPRKEGIPVVTVQPEQIAKSKQKIRPRKNKKDKLGQAEEWARIPKLR